MDVDGQDLKGDLRAALEVAGGVPTEMKLDLSGSELVLDRISVEGQRQNFDENYWSAKFHLIHGDIILAEPLVLSADSRVTISDARPLVAMFNNHGNAPRWLSRLLTLENIEGEASLYVADQRIVIPLARVVSDKAEVATKAVFYPEGRKGLMYARYNKLEILLRMADRNSKLDALRAREKFDAYQVRTPQ